MELLRRLLQNSPVDDPEDMDFLLDFSELLRDTLHESRFEDAAALVRCTIVNGWHEAFYWALGILEEVWDRSGGCLSDFECVIGKSIPDYDAFISRLGADLNAFGNDVLPMRDENGEIQSFYNIISYKTAFPHIRLVTSENFDTRDNDFIEYRLLCTAT